MNSDEEQSAPGEQHAWEHGWDGHEQQQLRRLARLSLREKLAWLEEAHRLVRQMAERSDDNAGKDE